MLVGRVELLVVFFSARMHHICLLIYRSTTLQRHVLVDPLHIAGIIQRLIRSKIIETYCDHEAFTLTRVELIGCIESIGLLILHNLRVVPRD